MDGNKTALKGSRILITGASSGVGQWLAPRFAGENEVVAIARFGDPIARQQLEAAGVTCVPCDLATSDFTDLPDDFDYLLNFAVARGGADDWERDVAASSDSIGLLMARLRSLKAVFHCSTAGVYKYRGPHHKHGESDVLGGIDHGLMIPSYPYTKIMAEGVVRSAARQYGLPATIARLSSPYSDRDGWPTAIVYGMEQGMEIPLHSDEPHWSNPIHEDDLFASIPGLLAAASVPATTVNWSGPASSVQDWCHVVQKLTGIEPRFAPGASPIPPLMVDDTLLVKLVGPTRVTLEDGLGRVIESHRANPLSEAIAKKFFPPK